MSAARAAVASWGAECLLPRPATRVSDKGVSRRIVSTKSAEPTCQIGVRWLLLFAVVLSSVSGCRNARYEECRAFVYAVNTRLAEIDRVTAQGAGGPGSVSGTGDHSVNPSDMRHLAELYERLADKTGKISIRSTELQQLRERYRTMVLDAARLARSIADSLEAKNIEAAMKAHEQFSAVVSREDELVSLVNAFCRQEQ